MPLFGKSHGNANTGNTGTNAGPGGLAGGEVDPMYNNERGTNQDESGGQLAGYHVPGVGLVTTHQAEQMQAINFNNQGTAGPLATNAPYHDAGMGMGTGHQNDAIPQGGMAQGTGVPVEGDPMYDNSRGHVAKRGAEGAALGGIAGHGGHNGHVGRDAAIGGAGAAAYEHEHNRHHHNQNGNTGGVGAGGVSDNQNNLSNNNNNNNNNNSQQQAALPNLGDANKLEKSAKVDKVIGTLTGNSNKKAEGLQKQAQAAAIKEQVRHLTAAQQLEAEAGHRRSHAVGLGADPSHVAPGPTQGVNSGVQPSYGTGQGAVSGQGVGGGGFGGLK